MLLKVSQKMLKNWYALGFFDLVNELVAASIKRNMYAKYEETVDIRDE